MRAMQPDIPMTAEQVLESVGRYKMKSINDFTHFESTSKIDPLDQYSFPDATEELTKDWPWDEAERLVKRSTSLQNMLGALETNTKVKDIVEDSKHWPVDKDFEEVIACQENPTWSPIASLVAKDEIKFPHFIVLMSHNDTEGNDNFLLRDSCHDDNPDEAPII
ncbi:uncharacterized protein ASPGLDRAFT_24447 [Aspergillus glaucus CBS 516.65]|uniref:Uncharacterized protein n=1 Tax=Aspergillus glaucus CBS 516.65 TaxID=1160497 RepID=A0A1L9VNA9_ASPGL|nr:hypothetical protein ASPGLDRAFT_24447 [Aspergillus glaucus CBS 516.65]OJJ85403.1 hypothetical protein ASPGLDRAFT_24447 [Aspergillus glaucus CBS 516.65]